MRCLLILATLAGILGLSVPGHADVVVEKAKLVEPEQLKRDVDVRDVTMQDGVVSGTVVNRSPYTLRDVRLVIRYAWLWKNEFRPGTDDPGRSVFYVLPDQIPPNGQVRFTYRPEDPLPTRSDGWFETQVSVSSVVEVEPAPTASRAAP